MRQSHPSADHVSRRVALPIEPSRTSDAPGQWVVCGGAIREVTDGQVICPLSGTPTSLGECIGCHCLVTHSGERDPLTDCAIPEIT